MKKHTIVVTMMIVIIGMFSLVPSAYGATYEKTFEAIQSDISTLKGQVASLQMQNAQLQTQIDSLSHTNAGTITTSNQNPQISTLDQRVTKVEGLMTLLLNLVQAFISR